MGGVTAGTQAFEKTRFCGKEQNSTERVEDLLNRLSSVTAKVE